MSDIGQGHDVGSTRSRGGGGPRGGTGLASPGLPASGNAAVHLGAPGQGPSTSQLPLERLRGFHPGWFGAVMGTAIVGVAASMNLVERPQSPPRRVRSARRWW